MKVSIICPVYNTEKYLEKCVDSILCQTMEEFELLLVDDGSTDQSLEICYEFEKRDSRVRVLKNPMKGVSAARNFGIQNAIGEYIMFVDSDDSITNDACEVMLKESHDVDIILSTYTTLYYTGKTIEHVVSEFNGSVDDFCKKIEEYLDEAIIQGPCWKLFKKKIIIDNSIEFPCELDFGEDAYFVYSFLEHTKTVKVVPESTYNYFIRNISLSHGFRSVKLYTNLMLNRKLQNLCDQYYARNIDIINKKNRVAFMIFLQELVCSEEKEKIKYLRDACQNIEIENAFGVKKRDDFLTFKQKIISKLIKKRFYRLLLLMGWLQVKLCR